MGEVVELNEEKLFLDDGTGTIRVSFEEPSMVENLDSGSTVRVFGSLLSLREGYELDAGIVQLLDDLDLDLYREVREEIKKFESEMKNKRR